ncbi:hypothetical protein DIURU_005602 [Diutina rugosa]|uniref:Spindle assembly checkpoint component MAD1 n=1 Tax=Diutina rugosa TaxID=5481 RepID=A0A642UCV1_DIURU|nr:uncharacterized protein DIURU_005602 [Diutina rugosa]KAA8896862.1 hypothetical protein DIURU_005602 [Diutina rugosa]
MASDGPSARSGLTPIRSSDGLSPVKVPREADLSWQVWNRESESMRHHYEDIIRRKDDEFRKLKQNFDFLKDEAQQQQSKLKNQEQILAAEKRRSLSPKPGSIPSSSEVELKSKVNSLVVLLKEKEAEVNQLKQENALLDQNLRENNQELQQTLDDHQAELDLLKQQAASHRAENVDREQLTDEIRRLSSQVTDLKAKVSSKEQRQFSVAVLEEELARYRKHASELEGAKLRIKELELDNMKLEARLNSPRPATNNDGTYLELLAVKDKYDELSIEFKGLLDKCQWLEDQGLELAGQVEAAEAKVSAMRDERDEAQRQTQLRQTEIDFLRNQINSGSDNGDYIKRLEAQVEELRRTTQQQQPLQPPTSQSPSSSPSVKRMRVENDVYKKLRQQNTEYAVQVKRLDQAKQQLEGQVKRLEQIISQQKDVRVLQLRANPLTTDQFIKQEQIDALREENRALRDENWHQRDVVPKATYDALQQEMSVVRSRVDSVGKRNLRLKEQYQKMTTKVTAAIIRYFGYEFRFVEDPTNPLQVTSKLKLQSKHYQGSGYLIIDIDTQELEVHGPPEFKSLCTSVAEQWVDPQNKPTLLLAALSLKLFSSSNSDRAA